MSGRLRREVYQAHDHDGAQHERGAGGQWVPSRLPPYAVEPIQSARDRPQDEDHGGKKVFDHTETGLGHRIISRLLVRHGRYFMREGIRNRVTVCPHVANVTLREPQLCQYR